MDSSLPFIFPSLSLDNSPILNQQHILLEPVPSLSLSSSLIPPSATASDNSHASKSLPSGAWNLPFFLNEPSRTLTSFELLPPEIIEEIAFHLCRHRPFGPPVDLLPFLSVSRRIYSVLGPRNEGFYADLFKERFDWKSVERRWNVLNVIEDRREKRDLLQGVSEVKADADLALNFGSFTRSSSPGYLATSTSPWRPLTSKDLCIELKRRCSVLSRLRSAALSKAIPPSSSRPSSPRLQPLTSGEYKSALGEPDELTQNLWTAYLMLLENDGKNLKHLIEYGLLRPYMRLFYKHSLMSEALKPGWPRQSTGRALGLWIGWLGGDDISTESPTESDERFFVLKPYVFGAHKFDAYHAPWTIPELPVTPKTHPLASAPSDPFTADLRPQTLAQTIVHMGRKIDIAPPILSHAAIFSFFFRVEQDPGGDLVDDSVMLPGGPITAPPPPPPFALHSLSNPITANTNATLSRKPTKISVPVLESPIHDLDFTRLVSCPDPYSSLGLPISATRGTLTGSWEGRFSFFDFDSYRDMLGGRMRSLYEGPFGDQPQVWKLEERVVRLNKGEKKGGRGPTLNAGYEIGMMGPRSSSTTVLVHAGSSKSTSPPPSGSASGGTSGRSNSLRRKSNEEGARASKRPRSLQEDLFEQEEEDFDDDDYEILLTGSGHSAWGQFLLKGRVRAWDGMFSITKEYTPDSRGRWLYRGYCVGGKLIGRWRDTHSAKELNGYEGNWSLSRRS